MDKYNFNVYELNDDELVDCAIGFYQRQHLDKVAQNKIDNNK